MGEAGHSLSRMFSQVHWSFLKKGCRLISSTPLRPNLTSLEMADEQRSNGFNPSETKPLDYCEAVIGNPDRINPPVCEEGADEALGIFRDIAVIRKRQRVLMVHDLAVGSHQRVGVKRRVPLTQTVEHFQVQCPCMLSHCPSTCLSNFSFRISPFYFYYLPIFCYPTP